MAFILLTLVAVVACLL